MSIPSKIIEVRKCRLLNKKNNSNINITSLSDVHISDKCKMSDLEFIIDTVSNLKPNYICILGDLIDSPEIIDNIDNYNKAINFIKELSSITKVFIVIGNHDYIHYYKDYKLHQEDYPYSFWRDISNIDNVYLLNDDIYMDDDVFIMGYTDKYNIYHNRDMIHFSEDVKTKPYLYEDIPKDKYCIGLLHSPEPLRYDYNQVYYKDYDLVLGGHYHNGCLPAALEHIWRPIHGGIVTPSKEILPDLVRGEDTINDGSTTILFNGGITKVGNSTPKYIHPLDKLCYRQIDNIEITNDIDKNMEVSYSRVRRKK